MRYSFITFALFSAIAIADVPLEPQSGFEWDLVNDARVVGYHIYIDGARNPVAIQQGDTNVDCSELNLTNGAHEIYATAYSPHQESAPSNILQFTYDGSTIQPPGLRLHMTFDVTVGGAGVQAGDDQIQVGD